MAQICQAIKNNTDITEQTLQLGDPELRILHNQMTAMRIRTENLMEIWVVINDQPRWCIVCPRPNRNNVIWETHQVAQAGIQKTISHIHLNWY